jgi:hypothetical protein
MRIGFRIAIAGALIGVSAAVPWLLQHQAQAALRAKHNAVGQQAGRLSFLLEDNGRLSNQVAQANASSALTAGQLRELMRLRNEKHALAQQAKAVAPLSANAPEPVSLSPAELKTALCAELVEAMKRVLPVLPSALQKYALDHSNQSPEGFSDLADYFPLVAGRRMAGLHEFEFVREQGPRPGDVLLLRASAGSRPGDGPEVRPYGFSDGRVLEVTSEEGHFDDWEKQHLTAVPSGTEDKVFLEAAGTAEQRARVSDLAASVGISAADARRFFDQLKQQEKTLGPRVEEMRKSLTGTPEEQQRLLQAAIEAELNKLAVETLGDKGPVLVQKLGEGK